MNTKIANARRFVKKNQAVIAVSVGVAAGISISYYTQLSGRTLLEVSGSNVRTMRETGASLVYETKHGNLMLTVIPNA